MKAREPITEIERRLHALGCPDHVVAAHVERLKRLRRVKRKRFITTQKDGRQFRQLVKT